MSAYMVTNTTIDRALSLWSADERGERIMLCVEWSCDDLDAMGQRMLRLNREALGARYPGDDMGQPTDEEIAEYRYPLKRVPRVQALKSLQCLIYQCSEGDIPNKSTLYKEMRDMERAALNHIVGKLPEYDAADWG